MSYIVFTDVETTGLEHTIHEVISVGIVIAEAETYEVVEKKEWHIKPEHMDRASPQALVVNGYTPEKWAARGELPAIEVFKELPRWLRRGLFAGHNCSFDIDFIWATAARLGVVGFPKRPWSYLDTRQLSLLLSLDGTTPNNKLDAMVKHFGFERSAHHGALEDADLSRRCAQEIYRRFRAGCPSTTVDAAEPP